MRNLDMLRDGGSIIIKMGDRPFCIDFSCDSKNRGSVYEGEKPRGDLINAGSELFSLVVDEVQRVLIYHERNDIYIACRPKLMEFLALHPPPATANQERI